MRVPFSSDQVVCEDRELLIAFCDCHFVKFRKEWVSFDDAIMSFTVEGKVCINNKIDHVVSCINIVTIAEPIDTIISREHSVKHEILKFQSGFELREEVCFVHTSMMAQKSSGLVPLANWFFLGDSYH